MKLRFWLKRTAFVLVSTFIVLATVYWMRGLPTETVAREAALWAGISSGVFLVFGLIRMRNPKARACALCDDGVTPPHGS